MIRQPKAVLFYFFVLLFLTSCGVDQGSGNPGLNGNGANFGQDDDGDYSGNFSSSGDIDPTGGYEDLNNALDNIPTENQAQKDAVAGAQQLLGSLMSAYGGLNEGDSATELQRFVEAMERNRAQAAVVAQLLAAAGFSELAEVFKKLAQKVDVMRVYNPATRRHMYWAASREAFLFGMITGQQYQGIAFRLFKVPQIDENCRRPLNSCLVQNDNFLSTAENCEGQKKIVRMGYLCTNAAPMNPLPLVRFVKRGQLHHLSTMNPAEINRLKASPLWKLEGPQGYPTF